MRLSLKAKQVAGVTAIVGLVAAALTAWFLSSLARVRLEESRARAELVADAVFHRAREVVAAGDDPLAALAADGGLRSILEASLYSRYVTYAAVTDVAGRPVAHSDAAGAGDPIPPAGDLAALVAAGPLAQARAIYTPGGRTFEIRQPLLLGAEQVGAIRVGVSTLLIRADFEESFRTPVFTAAIALVAGTVVAMLLAQLVLRPIHVIRSGLARLGRGELDVSVDLPADADLGDLGESFRAVSARLADDRRQLAGQQATLASVVAHLEDAVALVAPDGRLLFANPAMRAAAGGSAATLAGAFDAGHPYRQAVDAALAGPAAPEPRPVTVPGGGERLVLAQRVEDAAGRLLGVLLVVRNLAYLSQVESTLRYSRKLAALGRLSAGIAHEVKNPINATMIHLELLRMELGDAPAAREHLEVIAAGMRRLDEVVQGFLKFTRPEELTLEPVDLARLVADLLPVVEAEAGRTGVDVRVDVPDALPPVRGDAALLQQALLNLAINACQAMPDGGRLRLAAAARPGRRVEIVVEDTGVGIRPDQLDRVFDLYFTTKPGGSGIGLSMVYRTVQLHDGEIEVESVPGRGTIFRVLLPADTDEARA